MRIYQSLLDLTQQRSLLEEIFAVSVAAPFFYPSMPRTNQRMSVQITNAGSLGWVSDVHGYRYQANHPGTGQPWPRIPEQIINLWFKLTGYPAPPEACLINFYKENARLGLHRDEDEEDLEAPVLSISLGDTAIFRVGGSSRRDKTRSFQLTSGDALVLTNESRLWFHGVDRILPGTSRLVPGGGRINLTLRRVKKLH